MLRVTSSFVSATESVARAQGSVSFAVVPLPLSRSNSSWTAHLTPAGSFVVPLAQAPVFRNASMIRSTVPCVRVSTLSFTAIEKLCCPSPPSTNPSKTPRSNLAIASQLSSWTLSTWKLPSPGPTTIDSAPPSSTVSAASLLVHFAAMVPLLRRPLEDRQGVQAGGGAVGVRDVVALVRSSHGPAVPVRLAGDDVLGACLELEVGGRPEQVRPSVRGRSLEREGPAGRGGEVDVIVARRGHALAGLVELVVLVVGGARAEDALPGHVRRDAAGVRGRRCLVGVERNLYRRLRTHLDPHRVLDPVGRADVDELRIEPAESRGLDNLHVHLVVAPRALVVHRAHHVESRVGGQLQVVSLLARPDVVREDHHEQRVEFDLPAVVVPEATGVRGLLPQDAEPQMAVVAVRVTVEREHLLVLAPLLGGGGALLVRRRVDLRDGRGDGREDHRDRHGHHLAVRRSVREGAALRCTTVELAVRSSESATPSLSRSYLKFMPDHARSNFSPCISISRSQRADCGERAYKSLKIRCSVRCRCGARNAELLITRSGQRPFCQNRSRICFHASSSGP